MRISIAGGTGQVGAILRARLLEAGFSFDYPEWPEAVQDLVTRWRGARS